VSAPVSQARAPEPAPEKPVGLSQAKAEPASERPAAGAELSQGSPDSPAKVSNASEPAARVTPEVAGEHGDAQQDVAPVEVEQDSRPVDDHADDGSPAAARPAPQQPLNSRTPVKPPQNEPPAEWLEAPPQDDVPDREDDEEPLDVSQYLGDWSDEPVMAVEDALVDSADEISSLPAATGVAAHWLALFDQLGLSGLTQSIAAHCELVANEGGAWKLHLDPGHSALYNENHRLRLQQAISTQQGSDIRLEVEVQAPQQETPAIAAARRKAARQKAAEASINGDPMVQRLCSEFSAEICEGSIRPIDAPVI